MRWGPGEKDVPEKLGRFQVWREGRRRLNTGLWIVCPLSVAKNLFCTPR